MKRFMIIIFFFTVIGSSYGDEKKDISNFSRFSEEQLRNEERNLSSQSDIYEKNYRMGLVAYFLASKGKGLAKNAVDRLDGALKMKDNDYIRAYLGSAWTIAGSQADNVIDKVKFVNTGTKLLDDSYKKLGNEYSFLTMYVQNNLALPDVVFHRDRNAAEGIAGLEGLFGSLDSEGKACVLYLKACYLQKTGKNKDAIDLFEKITLDYKETGYSGLSKKMINKYGE
jgi:hypothetical protein